MALKVENEFSGPDTQNVDDLINPLDSNTSKRYSVVSLFSGCGGLDLGFKGGFKFKKANFERLSTDIVKAYDFDERCGVTYEQNIGPHFELSDLSKVETSTLSGGQILIGGFPCQEFSSCGPQGGLKSKRGQLYRVLIDYMATHRPLVVVGENVAHLALMNKGKTLETMLKDLNAGEYNFEVWHIFAPDYGIPQTRKRLFFVGVRKDLKGRPVKPLPEFLGKHRSIEWAISDLIKVTDESVPNQSEYFKAAKAINGHGQGDEACIREKPAYTIRANCRSRVQFHYELPRRLTVRECARVQTFPDAFVFPHSATSSIRQIGNAVPPVLAHKIAQSVLEFLDTQDVQ